MSAVLPLLAKSFARKAHSGQFRRDGTTPYFHHVAAVAARLANESAEVIATAYLHDVLEDTAYTEADMLSAGMSCVVVEAVGLLTKRAGEEYFVYLHRLRKNEIARKVKIADILSNLADAPTDKQIRKYAIGLLELVP
jgi:(p)ppGpp synthase/HD superfamily hydrolase